MGVGVGAGIGVGACVGIGVGAGFCVGVDAGVEVLGVEVGIASGVVVIDDTGSSCISSV